MIEVYRGWSIEPGYIGYYATHSDFDAEMVDGQWVGNGLQVHAMTIAAVRLEVDYYLEENGND